MPADDDVAGISDKAKRLTEHENGVETYDGIRNYKQRTGQTESPKANRKKRLATTDTVSPLIVKAQDEHQLP